MLNYGYMVMIFNQYIYIVNIRSFDFFFLKKKKKDVLIYQSKYTISFI